MVIIKTTKTELITLMIIRLKIIITFCRCSLLCCCMLVFFSVVAVRSQGPPTRTKKGSRPARRGDNVDRGLPSGADVPDGRRGPPPPAAGRPPMGGRPAPPARPAPAFPTRPAPRPTMTRTKKGRRPPAVQRGIPARHPAPLQRKPAFPTYNQVFPGLPPVSCDAFCERQGYKPVCSIYGNQYDNDCYRECRYVYILS